MSLWRPETIELRVGDAPAGSYRPGAAQRIDALAAEFEQALDTRGVRRAARLRCVIGGDAARYAIVPWNDDLTAPAQRQRLAEQTLRETYGDVACEWKVCQHSERYGVATLACAVDQGLLDRLDASAQARGLAVVSVQPALMHAFNQVRRRIAQPRFWFVLIEPQATTLLLMGPVEPLHVKRLPATGMPLAGVLEREWFALGIDAERCPAYVVHTAAGERELHEAMVSSWRCIDVALAPDAPQRTPVLQAA